MVSGGWRGGRWWCNDVVIPEAGRSAGSGARPSGIAAELLDLTRDEWHGMAEVLFEELFHGSAVKRTKFTGLKRNLGFLLRE